MGRAGERLAARVYERRGYVVLARNWRCPEGELDLVVARGGTIAFCEVKARSSAAFGAPVEAVGHRRQRRMRRAAAAWLQATGRRAPEVRFDVASVLPGQVQIVEGAF